jgi:hypothetical protein
MFRDQRRAIRGPARADPAQFNAAIDAFLA